MWFCTFRDTFDHSLWCRHTLDEHRHIGAKQSREINGQRMIMGICIMRVSSSS